MASFRAWAAVGPAVGPFDGTVTAPLDGKSERDRVFLERASLARRLPETRSLHNLGLDFRKSSAEVSATVTNSRGDVLTADTTGDTYGDKVTTRRLADHYGTKTSLAHDPHAGAKAVTPLPVSLVLSPNHRDDFMLDQLRTKTYIDRLNGTDTRSLYLDDPIWPSTSSRYLDDPVWRRSRYLDDPKWSSPSRILNDDLWRRPSTNKSSAQNDRQWRRAMRALM